MTNWLENPQVTIQLIATIFSAIAAIFFWQRRKTPGGMPLALLILAVTVWGFVSAFKNLAPTLDQAYLLAKLNVLGASVSAVLYLVFILEYTRQDYLLTRRALLIVWIIPLISFVLAISNDVHLGFWSIFRYDEVDKRFIISPGPLYWVHASYYYLLRITATTTMVWAIVRYPSTYRLQANALLGGAIAIWLGNILDFFKPFTYIAPWQLDLHPIAYTLSCIIIGWGIFRYQLFDVVPIARDVIVENMLYGIIVLDRNEHIVDINLPARYLFRINEQKKIIGKTLNEVFEHIPEIQKKLSASDMPFQDIYIPLPVDLYLEVMFTPIFDKQGQVRGKLLSIQDISARMRSEIALRQGEENLRNVFEGAPFPITVTSLDDEQILYINPAAQKLYAATGIDKRTLHTDDLYKNAEVRLELMEQLKEKGWVDNIELEMRTLDEVVIWTTTSMRKIIYNSKEALLITQVDISERKKAEIDLQQSRIQLKNIFENSGAGIHVLDPGGSITFSNKRWEDMLGYEASEMTGKSQSDFIFKNDIPYSRHLFESLIAGEVTSYQTEIRFVRKDEKYVWAILSATPIQDDTGEIESIVNFVSDITQKKQIENTLRETERRFREILENVSLFAVMLDTQGIITFCNDYIFNATGWHRNEIIGASWFDTLQPSRAGASEQFSRAVEKGNLILQHESYIVTRDNNRLLVAWSHILLRNENGNVIGTASVGQDITEQRRAQKEEINQRTLAQALSGISTALAHTSSFDDVLDSILEHAINAIKVDQQDTAKHHLSANISLIQNGMVRFLRARGYESHNIPNEVIQKLNFSIHKVSNLKTIYKSKKPLHIPNVKAYPGWVDIPTSLWINSFVGAPIIIKDKVVGFICLDSEETGFFTEFHADRLRAFSAQAAISIENSRLYAKSLHELDERKRAEARLRRANLKLTKQLAEIKTLQAQLREQAIRDALTGLYNRRHLEEILPKEINRCIKQKKTLSIIMMDLDHFKSINDSYGHPTGDKILILLGTLLKQECDKTGIACRYGGEEFVVVLPETPLDAAQSLAEKLRILLKSQTVQVESVELQASISLGVATMPIHGNHGHALLTAADHAMYQAKQDGRNCVRIAK